MSAMEPDDFFIDSDDEPKKAPRKEVIKEPKTSMFEASKSDDYNEPKTTIFNKNDRPRENAKPSYEFKSPVENVVPPVSAPKDLHSDYASSNPVPVHNNPVQNNIAPMPAPPSAPQQPGNKSKGFIAGILISFSKDPKGEFWAVRQGKNSIGSDPSNDIILNEANVSGQHAAINIRRSRKDGRLMFAAVDMCSEVGTLVNGEDIEFTTTELNMGDKLVVGGYEMLLLSFDKDKQGLISNSAFEELYRSSPSPSGQSGFQANIDYAASSPSSRDDATQISS